MQQMSISLRLDLTREHDCQLAILFSALRTPYQVVSQSCWLPGTEEEIVSMQIPRSAGFRMFPGLAKLAASLIKNQKGEVGQLTH